MVNVVGSLSLAHPAAVSRCAILDSMVVEECWKDVCTVYALGHVLTNVRTLVQSTPLNASPDNFFWNDSGFGQSHLKVLT